MLTINIEVVINLRLVVDVVCLRITGKKGWRLHDLEKKEFFVSRDVVFSETKFPYSQATNLQLIREDEDEGQLLWAPMNEGMIIDDDILQTNGPRQSVLPVYEKGSTSNSNGPTEIIPDQHVEPNIHEPNTFSSPNASDPEGTMAGIP